MNSIKTFHRYRPLVMILFLFLAFVKVYGSEKDANNNMLSAISEPILQITFNYLDICDLKAVFFLNYSMMELIKKYFKFHFHTLQEFCLQFEFSSPVVGIPERSLCLFHYFPSFERQGWNLMKFDLRSAIFNQIICKVHSVSMSRYLPPSKYYPTLFNVEILMKFILLSIFIHSEIQISPHEEIILLFQSSNPIQVQYGHQEYVYGNQFTEYFFEHRLLYNGYFSFRTRVPAFFYGVLNHESQILLLVDQLLIIRSIDIFDGDHNNLPPTHCKLLFQVGETRFASDAVRMSDLGNSVFLTIKVSYLEQ